jgi:hypothetical protein
MNLYLCTATSPIGIFSDYVWAANRDQAVRKFYDAHGTIPHHIFLERKRK